MPNFSSLADLEVAEKFVVGWGGEHVTTMSNSNASCFRVELSWVALGFDNLTICTPPSLVIISNISDSCRMSPGGFSLRLLVPVFLRRRSKKYEKLETEDPEKKKQEATLDELVRINFKIVSQFML